MTNDLEIMSLAFEASSPLLIADKNQLVIGANQAVVDLSGFSVEVLCGMSLGALYSTQRNNFTHDVEGGILEFLSDPETSQFHSGKTVRVSKAGQVIDFIETITVVRDERGRPEHYVVNFQDVSQLLETEQALRESKQTYVSLIESMHDGVIMLDRFKIIDCNEQFARMMSSKKGSIVGRSIDELSIAVQADGSNSQEKAAQVVQSVLAGRPGWIEWTLRRPDDWHMEVEASLSPSTLEGQPIVLATIRDITARKKIEQERFELLDALARKEEFIRLAGKASGVISWSLDIGSREITWSDGAAEFLGFEIGDLSNSFEGLLKIMPDEESVAFDNLLSEAISSGQPLRFETPRRMVKNGQEKIRWFCTQGQVEYDAQGEATSFHGTVSDITEQKEAQQEIARLAYYDPLTGLANRRLLLDRLEQCCSHAERRGTSGALLFIDLDRFKLLNDSLGHQVGDELLKEVAQRLQQSLRKEDTVARLGGDEFVVLLPSIDGGTSTVTSRVRHVADLLRRNVARDYKFNKHNYHMSGSIGVAIFPQDSCNADNILEQADAAMYLAKKSGRDTVAFYHATLQAEADSRLTLERDLRVAVDGGQLELYFQPKVDVERGGLVVGAEALLRWNHPEEGIIMPDTFIPVAEETGLIIGIGHWVLESACEQVVNWNKGLDRDSAIGVAVNVSPIQFRHRSFVGDVKRLLLKNEIDPSLITLEITEGTLIENLEDTQLKLDELQRFGVRLSIDDFGTGYSSLYYLKNLPLDEIKIDRIYVQDIIDDDSDAAIVASILAIADNLGLSAVAEGIETKEQADFLLGIGCNINQGYLYSKPIPAGQFTTRYLQTHCASVLDRDEV
jgi:diguanylate cyclase (GGDEF)-like protein/PAS domain S-box-containing protein